MTTPMDCGIDFTTLGPAVGERFPDVILPDQHGQRINLHQARNGRRALVVFYRSAAWWPFCKSQLVELQRNLPDFARHNIAVFGISYDPVDVLARFAGAHGVTFPLLSDEGSKVIRALGMLDEQVYEHHAAFDVTDRDDRFWGVPYPGVFLLDEQGNVMQKRFQKNYRERETSQTILEHGFGMDASSHGPEVRGEAGGVAVRAFLDAEQYRIYQRLRVNVEIVVPSGWHVYGLPIPEGYVPLSVSVAPIEGLEVGEPVLPTPHPFRVEGLEEQFFVYDGTVSVAVPAVFTQNVGDQTLRLEVRFQACSADQCQRPHRISVSLRIQAETHVDWHM